MTFRLVNLRSLKEGISYDRLTKERYRAGYDVVKQFSKHALKDLSLWEDHIQVKETKHWKYDRLRQNINKRSKDGHYIEIYDCEYQWLIRNPLERYIKHSELVELGWNKDGFICKAAYVLRLHELLPKNLYDSENVHRHDENSYNHQLSDYSNLSSSRVFNHDDDDNDRLKPKDDHLRYLFYCLGMDGGLKTAYVTPFFKYRTEYSSSLSVPYRNKEQFHPDCFR